MKTRTRIVGFFAVLLLLGILVGLPWLLVTIAGSPIPANIPSFAQLGDWLTRPDDGTLALGVLKYCGWLVWLFLAVSLVMEIVAQTRGIQAPHLPGMRVPQLAARQLVAAAAALLIAVPLTGGAVHTASAQTISSAPSTTAAQTTAPTPAPDQTPTPAEDQTQDTPPTGPSIMW